MSSRSVTVIFIFFLFTAVAFEYTPKIIDSHIKSQELATVFKKAQDQEIGSRNKSIDCRINGPYPDSSCTPGAIFPETDLNSICLAGYTKTVRDVPLKLRKSVFSEYAIYYPEPRGSYEVDHLIPLALGGSNDIANLFPEAAEPYPGFREKDVVENFLHEKVCQREINLKAAQAQIANNWLMVYQNLTTDQISELKARYKNWSTR